MSIRTKTKRSMISRREPVIALTGFRYRGRNYKEGGNLDRRRCRMPHTKLVRLIREGVCIMASDMNPEKLAEYGFIYTPESPRMKLTKISADPQKANDILMGFYFPPEDESILSHSEMIQSDVTVEVAEVIEADFEEVIEVEPVIEEPLGLVEPVLKHVGGGWYDILVNDEPINDDGMRKKDALKLIETMKEGS